MKRLVSGGGGGERTRQVGGFQCFERAMGAIDDVGREDVGIVVAESGQTREQAINALYRRNGDIQLIGAAAFYDRVQQNLPQRQRLVLTVGVERSQQNVDDAFR